MALFQPNDRILFQGDSITDGNRGRNDDPNHILGHGYPFIIAAKYATLLPELNLTFINRGISGNQAGNLAARWQEDTLDLQPSLLSVLVGVNDSSVKIPHEQYEATYDDLLSRARAANPALRLVLMEPFTLPGARHAEDWEEWRSNLQGRQDAVARLAQKYGAVFVKCQAAFDAALNRAPADYWIWDTVHPTYAGQQILADAWVGALTDFTSGG